MRMTDDATQLDSERRQKTRRARARRRAKLRSQRGRRACGLTVRFDEWATGCVLSAAWRGRRQPQEVLRCKVTRLRQQRRYRGRDRTGGDHDGVDAGTTAHRPPNDAGLYIARRRPSRAARREISTDSQSPERGLVEQQRLPDDAGHSARQTSTRFFARSRSIGRRKI